MCWFCYRSIKIMNTSFVCVCVCFTDKTTFQFSKKANRPNMRLWGSKNPYKVMEHVRNSPKVNVWSILMNVRVIDHWRAYRNCHNLSRYDATLCGTSTEWSATLGNFPTCAITLAITHPWVSGKDGLGAKVPEPRNHVHWIQSSWTFVSEVIQGQNTDMNTGWKACDNIAGVTHDM